MLPQPVKRVNPALPTNVRSAYTEALDCFRIGSLAACVIMCRKAIEALCREHGIEGLPLAMSLNKLKDTDVIDGRLFDWANLLRLAGNDAAHEVESKVQRGDASDVIDFTHALLEYTFTFQDKFKAFMDRRKNSGGNLYGE